MNTRESFEKAFKQFTEEWPLKVMLGNGEFVVSSYSSALWAAKWMADLIAHGKNKTVQAPCPDYVAGSMLGCAVYHTQVVSMPYSQEEIHQLAKDLED